MFHALLSVEPAGSSVVSPVAKPDPFAVTPPTIEAVPLPTEGAVEPVVVLPSGVTLLKFHCAKTTGFVNSTVSEAAELVTLPAILVMTTE